MRAAMKRNAPDFTSGQFLRCGAAPISQLQQATGGFKSGEGFGTTRYATLTCVTLSALKLNGERI